MGVLTRYPRLDLLYVAHPLTEWYPYFAFIDAFMAEVDSADAFISVGVAP